MQAHQLAQPVPRICKNTSLGESRCAGQGGIVFGGCDVSCRGDEALPSHPHLRPVYYGFHKKQNVVAYTKLMYGQI